VVRVEFSKLTGQFKAWAPLASCVLGPFAFAVCTRVQSATPDDTLFGRWVKASGFAVPLVVLGFAAFWAFPLLTSIVGGDLFSAEDRYGTWPTLLTRSRTRGELFTGKVLAALTYSLLAVSVLAVSSLLAGILVVGQEPLLGLSSTLLPPGRSLALVAAAWVSVLPPALGFTALAVLSSTATRSSAAGVGLPVLLGFVMQLASYLNGPSGLERTLLTPALFAWHGLFTERPYFGPLAYGAATSIVYFLSSLAVASLLMQRRDMGN
jgi:ABC-2 type transport system permease protein